MNLRRHLRILSGASTPTVHFRRELLRSLCPPPAVDWRRMVALPIAIVFLFLGTGVGAYAYASPEVTDSHPLYRIKRGIEGIESSMYRSDEAQASFHARMMERRLNEAEVLLRMQAMQETNMDEVEEELTASLSHIQEEQMEQQARVIERLQWQHARMRLLMQQMEEARADATLDSDMLRNTLLELRVNDSVTP